MGLIATVGIAGTAKKEGNVITLEGSVDAYMYGSFKREFTDEVTHIKINSGGGYVKHGMKIADLIYERKDKVFTEAIGDAQSMAAIIWLSADHHVYNDKGKIGFHLPYVKNVDHWRDLHYSQGIFGVISEARKMNMEFNLKSLEYLNNKEYWGEMIQGLLDYGMDPWDMWFPSKDKLEKFEGQFKAAPPPLQKPEPEPEQVEVGRNI